MKLLKFTNPYWIILETELHIVFRVENPFHFIPATSVYD